MSQAQVKEAPVSDKASALTMASHRLHRLRDGSTTMALMKAGDRPSSASSDVLFNP
jgi:hypothetical protein